MHLYKAKFDPEYGEMLKFIQLDHSNHSDFHEIHKSIVDLLVREDTSDLPYVTRGFWAVILYQAVWKRSWVPYDPTQSKMAVDRSVANTSDMARAQLLTA